MEGLYQPPPLKKLPTFSFYNCVQFSQEFDLQENSTYLGISIKHSLLLKCGKFAAPLTKYEKQRFVETIVS